MNTTPMPARLLPEIDGGGRPPPRVLPVGEALMSPDHNAFTRRGGVVLSDRAARRIEARLSRQKGGQRR